MNGLKLLHDIDFSVNGAYDYIFSAVPSSKRKSTWRLIAILSSFAFSPSGLTVGANIGSRMTFCQAVAACFIGNLVLFLVALVCSMLAHRLGYNSVFLVKKIFGNTAGNVFSVLIILSMIIWIGINGDLFAKTMVSVFPTWSPPIPVTILLIILFWAFCSFSGWRSLEWTNIILLPGILLFTIYHVIRIGGTMGGFGFVWEYKPELYLPFSSAIIMIIGNYSVSAMTIPDICRFAKSKCSVILCTTIFASFIMISNICGILIVQAAKVNSLNYGVVVLGMAVSYFIWVVFCISSTQNINIYTSSLAIQNLVHETPLSGNISHKTAVLLVGGLSAIIGIVDIINYLTEVCFTLAMAMLSLFGILLIEILIGKNYKTVEKWIPLLAWLIGSFAGWILWLYGKRGAWILPLLISSAIYYILRISRKCKNERDLEEN